MMASYRTDKPEIFPKIGAKRAKTEHLFLPIPPLLLLVFAYLLLISWAFYSAAGLSLADLRVWG